MNEILCFLFDFTDPKKDDHIEKLRCAKQRLVTEFEDYNLSKLIQILNDFDDVNVLIKTNNLDSRLEKTNSLRELIFYLISFKHFVINVD